MGAKYDNTDGRMRGRKLQARRLRVWSQDPHCANCRKLVEYSAKPGYGFELDHIDPLKAAGGKGEDTEDNLQVLCAGPKGCHAKKTATDMGYTPRAEFDVQGRVVW